MKIGTKVIAYYLPSSEDEPEDPPQIVQILHGTVIDPANKNLDEFERTINEDLVVRFPCKEHPRSEICNCENNIRSMHRAGKEGPHLYEEDYYGGYYGQVVIVEEN